MSERNIVLMFSGQGSQYYQMGRSFFDANAAFRRIVTDLDAMAIPMFGFSVIDVLYDERRRKSDPFNDLKQTSAAIFTVEFALARVLIDDGVKPDYLLASSLGLYAAAAIAGVLEARDVLGCLAEVSMAYETLCPKASMLAILSSPALYYDLTTLREHSDIAAINFDSHFVISTASEHLARICAALRSQGVIFQEICVSYAFHSRWIDAAKDVVLAKLGALCFRQPTIPLVCCAQAKLVETVSPVTFWNSVRQPIEFARTIAGLETCGPNDYIDVGPSGTLATFLRYTLPALSTSKAYPTLSPFNVDLKNYERVIAETADLSSEKENWLSASG
ncbi:MULTISPECIES: acyltransferase domain-containing protein [unclassified Bradyrhizobium]|uniref:acyltransferase domain-containing protein n=1 Tax=unclassified Bradyrhizobium TaxID=2631580 RepID=UPI00291642AF|nr:MULTISPECIES: acyltransferase domain-containing protein [unclassified Bradyrhizobium]